MLRIRLSELERILAAEIEDRCNADESAQASARYDKLTDELREAEQSAAKAAAAYPFWNGESFLSPSSLSAEEQASLVTVRNAGKSLATFQKLAATGRAPEIKEPKGWLRRPVRLWRKFRARQIVARKDYDTNEPRFRHSKAQSTAIDLSLLRAEEAQLRKFAPAALEPYAEALAKTCQNLRQAGHEHAFVFDETDDLGLLPLGRLSVESQSRYRDHAAHYTVGNSKPHQDPAFLKKATDLMCLSHNGKILWNELKTGADTILVRDRISDETPETLADFAENFRNGRTKYGHNNVSQEANNPEAYSGDQTQVDGPIILTKKPDQEIMDFVEGLAHEGRHRQIFAAFGEDIKKAKGLSGVLTEKLFEADAFAVSYQIVHEVLVALGDESTKRIDEDFRLMGENCCARMTHARFLRSNVVKTYEEKHAKDWQRRMANGEWDELTTAFAQSAPALIKKLGVMPDGTPYLREKDILETAQNVGHIRAAATRPAEQPPHAAPKAPSL